MVSAERFVSHRTQWIIVALLCLAALAEISYRSPLRDDKPFQWDFANAYSASRVWLAGGAPYQRDAVLRAWGEAGEQPWRMMPEYWAAVHPPTTLVMLAPFATLPALPAMLAWFAFTLGLFIVALIALVSIAQLSWRDARAWLLIAGIIASAPAQVTLLAGQTAGPSVAFIVLALWCIMRCNRQIAGGVLLGIATAFKLQLGGPFLLYYLMLRPRPRVVVPAALIVLIVAVIGIAPMELRHDAWRAAWLGQIQSTVEPGGVNDPTPGARYRFELLNVHVLLHGVIRDDHVIRWIGAVIVTGLLALYVAAIRRSERERQLDERLALAALAALALVPFYHKEYDAMVLAIALAWAIAALGTRLDRAARLAIVAMAVFLVPADFIQSLRIRIPAVDRAAEHSWFNVLLVPHYAWGLLALCAVLTITCWRVARLSAATLTRGERADPRLAANAPHGERPVPG